MKKLHFEPGAVEYELIYQATLFAGKDTISPEDHLTIAAIRKQFRAIGVANEDSWEKKTDPRRRLVLFECPAGGDVLLEDADHKLLIQLFDSTGWKPFMSEDAASARKLLNDAPAVPVAEAVSAPTA